MGKRRKLRVILYIALGVVLLAGGYETVSAISDAKYPTYTFNDKNHLSNNNVTYVFDQVVTPDQVTLKEKIAKTSAGDPVYKIQGQDPANWIVVTGSGLMAPSFLYRNSKLSQPDYGFLKKQ